MDWESLASSRVLRILGAVGINGILQRNIKLPGPCKITTCGSALLATHAVGVVVAYRRGKEIRSEKKTTAVIASESLGQNGRASRWRSGRTQQWSTIFSSSLKSAWRRKSLSQRPEADTRVPHLVGCDSGPSEAIHTCAHIYTHTDMHTYLLLFMHIHARCAIRS